MNFYLIVDSTTSRHVIGVLANSKKAAKTWATKNGFYNRFNNAILIRGEV